MLQAWSHTPDKARLQRASCRHSVYNLKPNDRPLWSHQRESTRQTLLVAAIWIDLRPRWMGADARFDPGVGRGRDDR